MAETYRCTCADVPDAPSPGCLGDFWSLKPRLLCGDPICEPCWESFQETLGQLAKKGVRVTITDAKEGRR